MPAFFCPNLSNPDVKRDFESLVSSLGENRAYFQWNKHQGDMSAISKTSNNDVGVLPVPVLEQMDNANEKSEQEIHTEAVTPILNFIDNNNNAKDVLNYIKSSNLTVDPRLKELLDMMIDNVDDTLTVDTAYDNAQEEIDQGAYMLYHPDTHGIKLIRDFVEDVTYGNVDDVVKALIHEYIHSFTSRAIMKPTTPEQIAFAKEVEKIYKAAKSVANEEDLKQHGFLNAREFVSEIMTDTKFLETVKKNEKYRPWQRFLLALAKFFKMDISKYKSSNESIFDLVMNFVPQDNAVASNFTSEQAEKRDLKSVIYELRETLDIENKTDFVKQLRDFEKKFDKDKGVTIYTPTNYGLLATTKVMAQYEFGIDPSELKKDQTLKEAADRGGSIGNVIHGTAESILKDVKANIKNKLGFVSTPGLRDNMKEILTHFKGQDITVISELWIADLRKAIGGKIDMVVIDENNKIHIYDFKSKEGGFGSWKVRFTDKSGKLKYSYRQTAMAQLTIYKNIFENMTGYEVATMNAVLIKPTTDEGNAVTGATLDSIDTIKVKDGLGQAIFDDISNINIQTDSKLKNMVNADGKMTMLTEERLKTLNYQEHSLSATEDIFQSLITSLENKLSIMHKRGNLIEAKALKEQLDDARTVDDAVDGIQRILKEGLILTKDIINLYNNMKKDGKDITIGRLHYWKDFVSAYGGLGDYLQYLQMEIFKYDEGSAKRAEMQELQEKVKKLIGRATFIERLYETEGASKLADFLTPFYNKERSEFREKLKLAYRALSSEEKGNQTEDDFISDNLNDPATKDRLDIRTKKLLEAEIKKASRDIDTMSMWLDNLMDSKDPITAAMVKAFAKAEYETHTESITVRDSLVRTIRNLEKVNTNTPLTDYREIYGFALEKGEDGKLTGYLQDKYLSNLYEEYNDVVKLTNTLTKESLKELSESEGKGIAAIAQYYMQEYGFDGVMKDIALLSKLKQSIRKAWKDERSILDVDGFLAGKAAFMETLLKEGKLTELQLEEIVSNDDQFVKGNSELTLKDLANQGTIPMELADEILSWIYNNSWTYRDITPQYTKRYVNSEFAEFKKLEGTNDPKWLFYKHVRDLMEAANDALPYASRIGLRLPGVIKQSNEFIKEGDLKGGFIEGIRDTFNVRPDDPERDNKQMFNVEGKPRYFLPIHYTQKVEPELQSYDLPTIIFKFWNSAQDFTNKLEILPEMELAKFFIENRDFNPAAGAKFNNTVRNITTRKELSEFNNNLAVQVNEWFMSAVYGMPVKDQGSFKVFGLEFDTAQTIDSLNKYTALNLLGLNFIQGTANAMLGEAMQTAERVAGEYMSKKAYRRGTKFYLNNFTGILGDVGSRSPKNVVSKLIDGFDIMDEWEGTEFTRNTKFRHLMTTNTAFFTAHAGEHEMQGRFLLSMLSDKTAVDKDGNDLGSMLELYNVDDAGNLVLDNRVHLEKSEWTADDQFEFSYKVRGILSRLHGEYSELGRTAIQRAAVGRMAFMFRKFLVPGFKRRWGKKDYVERLDDFVEGSYITTGNFLKNLTGDIVKLKWDVAGAEWGKLSDHEKANIKRTITEVSFLIVATIIGSLAINKIKDMDGDDDEGMERALSFLAYQAVRFKSEMLMFILPGSAWDILRSPMASMSSIENIGKLLQQLTDEPFEKYERGPWKGQNKTAKYLTNMTPGYRQYFRLRDVRDQLAWFSTKIN